MTIFCPSFHGDSNIDLMNIGGLKEIAIYFLLFMYKISIYINSEKFI